MRINNTNTADGTKLALLLVTLIVAVSAVSCGNNSDGDVTAYCDVISKNLDLGVPDTNLPIDQLVTKELEFTAPIFSSKKESVSTEFALIKLAFSVSEIDRYTSPTIFSSLTIIADCE